LDFPRRFLLGAGKNRGTKNQHRGAENKKSFHRARKVKQIGKTVESVKS
jgi:hypothetical protein